MHNYYLGSLSNRSKYLLIGLLLLGVFAYITTTVFIKQYERMNGCRANRLPLRIDDVSINAAQSQEMLVLLKRFADKNAFDVEAGYYGIKGDYFSIWMDRKDVEVLSSNSSERGEFQIAFYNNDCIHPAALADTDGLFSDLKIILSEIPNIKISERK